MTYNEIVQ